MRALTKYFELACWIIALAALGLMHPGDQYHFSLCIFKMVGIDFCPGCGLGHSISYLLRGNLQASFSCHPLGIFAVAIIIYRIYKLLQHHFTSKKRNTYYGNI